MVLLIPETSQLSEGNHVVILMLAHEEENENRIIWEFECVDGNQHGAFFRYETGNKLKPGTDLWRLLYGMLGGEMPRPDQWVDTDELVAESFTLSLRDDGSGAAVFDSITNYVERQE